MPKPEVLSVSVIIPTKNRPTDLEIVVRSVLRQTYLPHELLIVDQGSGDDSQRRVEGAYAEAAASASPAVSLNYIRGPEISGLTEARNRAIAAATGGVWLFLDDDVVLEPEFVEELLSVYTSDLGVTGVSGVVTNYAPYPWPFRLWSAVFVRSPFQDPRQRVYWRANRMRETKPVRVDRLGGGLMSFRADAIRGFRFDPNHSGVSDGEDVDFCMQLGPQAVLMMAPKARLVHNSSPSGRERSHWLQRDSRAQRYLYLRHWNHGVKNRICFLWLCVGYALVATLSSLHHRSFDPWRALRAGIREANAIPR